MPAGVLSATLHVDSAARRMTIALLHAAVLCGVYANFNF